MKCPSCSATGLIDCPKCKGRGCSACKNSGKQTCPNCKGKGQK